MAQVDCSRVTLNDVNEPKSNSLKLNKVRIKQDLFFGEIPLITEEGTFVINGCERIVISQIIRSPGVYFRKEFGTIRKTCPHVAKVCW